ncbi:MAG: PAS domain-containing protein [Bacteroidales bacterium]|nr:PAS domain-containing protein [Bacteroidales bacterium]
MQNHHLHENLKNFFEADINFHWVLDNDGTILAINETVKQRLGYTEEELTGKSVLMVHPAERQEEAGRIVQAMLEGKERFCKVPIVSKQGEHIPVETYITRGVWNGVPALFGISKDISELKLSQEKFFKIFNTSPNIIGLSELETGIYVEVNQAFYDILGFTPEEVIGKRARDLVRFEDKYRNPIAMKLKREGFVREVEAVIYSKEGRPVPVLLSASVIEIYRKKYNLTIAVDITYRKLAENLLKESHVGLLDLFDTMDVPVYIADPSTYDLIYINQALKKHFGEPDGKKCFQYLQNLGKPCSFCTNPLILGDHFGKTYSWEFQNRATGRWYKCLDKALLWPDGRIVRYEIAFDITAQKEAEEALRENMEILNATQRLARIGGWEFDLEKNTMTWADETYLIHGFQPGEIPAGSEEHIQQSLSCYFPADRQAVLEAFNKCVEQGKSYNLEFPLKRADGRIIWVQTMANAVFEEGRIVKVIGNLIDITERKLAQDCLVESEERLRLAHLATNDVVWDWDIIQDTQKWNEAGTLVFGWTKIVSEPQTAQWWVDRVHPDDRERVGEGFFSVVKDPEKTYWQDEYRFLKTDGTYAQVIDRGYVLRDPQGKALRMVGAMQDITKERKSVEELERVGVKMKLAAESAGFGIWEWNVDSNELTWDDSMFSVYGIEKNEFTHHFEAWRSRVHPDDLKASIDALNKTIALGIDFDTEFRIIRPDGEIRYIKANAVVQRDMAGRVIRLTGINYDLTRLKQSEEILKESKMKLQLALDVAKMGYWRYEIATGRVEWSKGHDLLFGISMDAFRGNLNAVQECVHPDDRAPGEANLRRTIEENIPYNNTYRVVHPDGTVRWMFSHGHLYRERSDDPGFIFGITQDITERKHTEEQLQQLSSLRQLLVELSTKFINLPLEKVEDELTASLKQTGEFVQADRSYIFEYNWEKQLCTNTYEWCAEGIEPQIHNLQHLPVDLAPEWIEAHSQGNTLYIPVVASLPEGGIKSLLELQRIKSVLTVPMMNNMDCIGFVGFDSVRDFHNFSDLEQNVLMVFAQMLVNITMRKRTENELISARIKAEESNRLKSAFLASMSHEIRTPMNGILGFLQLLKDMDLTSEERDRFIEIVNKSGQRLLRTINDIIEMSKIEAGQIQVIREEIDLHEMMQFLLEFFSRQAREKGLTLEWEKEVPGQHLRIFSDQEKLNSILTNLLNNAIKFTERGDIRFGYQIENDQLRFFVQDTGSGIPPDRTEAVFERFIQGDLRISSPHEGSGLGLSIAKAYCEKLGGSIGVDSVLGKGSTFSFTIRYEPILTKAEEQSIQKVENQGVKSGITILVAEDDEISFQYLESILVKEGFKLIRTINGEETVDVIRDHPEIPLILLDIRMGKKSGLEAAREIRAFNPSVVIIAQTAYALTGDREKALAAGCNDYIAKPIEKESLLKIIHTNIMST